MGFGFKGRVTVINGVNEDFKKLFAWAHIKVLTVRRGSDISKLPELNMIETCASLPLKYQVFGMSDDLTGRHNLLDVFGRAIHIYQAIHQSLYHAWICHPFSESMSRQDDQLHLALHAT